MTLLNLLLLIAVASSVVLVLRRRLYGGIALAASGLLALLSFNIVSFSIRSLSLDLVLGGVIAIAGVFAYLRVRDRPAVTAATLLVTVGGILVLMGLGVV